jgi:hypothetical protein
MSPTLSHEILKTVDDLDELDGAGPVNPPAIAAIQALVVPRAVLEGANALKDRLGSA